VGVTAGHFLPFFTQVLVPHSFSSLQHLPGLTHSLFGQRLPPVHSASFVQLALIPALSVLSKGLHLFSTKLAEH
jgi:hypothetical protein